MDTEHYTNTNIFQRAQTFQNVLQPAPGEEAVSGKSLKWVLGFWRTCQIALVSYYGWCLGCACCVMLTSSTSGRYVPALEQPFRAAGWVERRIRLSEGLETSLERLLRCCSVLLQSLLPAFVKVGCSSMVKRRSSLSVPCVIQGLAEFEARVTPCLPGQVWWGMAVACHAMSCSLWSWFLEL